MITPTELITLMCLDADPEIYHMGRLLRRAEDTHTCRPDDHTCDYCGVPWPCDTADDVLMVVHHYDGRLGNPFRGLI